MSTVTRFTLDQYERMIEGGVFADSTQRLEFIRGEIREMSPLGPRHCTIVDRLNRWSCNNTDEERLIVRIQGATRMPMLNSEPEPDVLWLARKNYATAHPLPSDVSLLIEVADSSLGFDLGEKAQLYAAAGIPDYWVVDLVEDCIHVFRDPQPSGYASRQVQRGDESLSPLEYPSVLLVPEQLFAETYE